MVFRSWIEEVETLNGELTVIPSNEAEREEIRVFLAGEASSYSSLLA
jgi:hypothetical protein